MHIRFWSVSFLVPLLSGCLDPLGVACTHEAVPAFSVTVTDSVMGGDLSAAATVWVRDGSAVDTLDLTPNGTFTGAYERPGTYEVVAEHPDYLAWRLGGVRVREGTCHVITRTLEARLVSRS